MVHGPPAFSSISRQLVNGHRGGPFPHSWGAGGDAQPSQAVRALSRGQRPQPPPRALRALLGQRRQAILRKEDAMIDPDLIGFAIALVVLLLPVAGVLIYVRARARRRRPPRVQFLSYRRR